VTNWMDFRDASMDCGANPYDPKFKRLPETNTQVPKTQILDSELGRGCDERSKAKGREEVCWL